MEQEIFVNILKYTLLRLARLFQIPQIRGGVDLRSWCASRLYL